MHVNMPSYAFGCTRVRWYRITVIYGGVRKNSHYSLGVFVGTGRDIAGPACTHSRAGQMRGRRCPFVPYTRLIFFIIITRAPPHADPLVLKGFPFWYTVMK